MTPNAYSTLTPTLEGYYVADPDDAAAIFQLVLDEVLPLAHRRPKESERPYIIKSGNVFVFKEMKGHIQRWTDGMTWSASRILHPFLVYRQDTKNIPKKEGSTGQKQADLPNMNPRSLRSQPNVRISKSRRYSSDTTCPSLGVGSQATSELAAGRNCCGSTYYTQNDIHPGPQGSDAQENDYAYQNAQNYPQSSCPSEPFESTQEGIDHQLFGSLKNADYPEDGLAKKTMSVKFRGISYRLVSYFTKPDVLQGKLIKPMSESRFRVKIEKELLDCFQENKTSLDIPEPYYMPQQGHYYVPPHMQSFPGFPPSSHNGLPGYPAEFANQQQAFDSGNVNTNMGRQLVMSSRGLARCQPPSQFTQGGNLLQQYNFYPSSAAPPEWLHDGTSGYRVPNVITYGNHSVKNEGYSDVAQPNESQPSKEDIHIQPANHHEVSEIFGYESSRYLPSVALPPGKFSTTSSHAGHHGSGTNRSSNLRSGPGAMRPVRSDAELAEHRNQSESQASSLAENTAEAPGHMRSQHDPDLLSPIDPESPLEPQIGSGGISATTFIPQSYEYGDSENSSNTGNTSAQLGIQCENRDLRQPRPLEFHSQYVAQPHSTVTQRTASPNIYFSTGRSWH